MCIAILNNSETLSIDTIKNSFENNRDGASFTYIENDTLKTYKEMQFQNVKTFYQNYAKIRENNTLPIMLHFRIGTSGIRDKRNLHPFFVNQNLALVHNGIIDIPTINSEYSDTYHFAKLCRQFKNHDKFLNVNSIEFQSLQDMIGTNKIIYLSNKGKYSIMNENLGHWDNNNWYSNSTYKQCNYYDFGGIKKYKNSSNEIWNTFTSTKFDNCIYNDSFHVNNFGWFMELNYHDKLNQIKQIMNLELNHNELNKLHSEYSTQNLYDLYIELCYVYGIVDMNESAYEIKT